MARPTTRRDLEAEANRAFEKLWELIDSMPDSVQHDEFAFDGRDRNLRDVLMHLWEWQMIHY